MLSCAKYITHCLCPSLAGDAPTNHFVSTKCEPHALCFWAQHAIRSNIYDVISKHLKNMEAFKETANPTISF